MFVAAATLLLALLSHSSVCLGDDKPQAKQGGIVITKQYSTLYNYTSPGGPDPKLVQFIPQNIAFGQGTPLNASQNATRKGEITTIGIKVLSNRELQPVYGVGCGVTDAASIALQDLKAVQPDTYKEIMSLLWNQDQREIDAKGGAGLTFTRSPLGACDFGTNIYSYDDTADCSPDEKLSLFTIDKAPKMWATHQDIKALNPNIQTFWAPWSPPAWMKSSAQNCSMIGGSLLEKYEGVFADYLVKSMTAIKQKLGITPVVLSLQNEPLYASDKYPGSKMPPEQAARVSLDVRKKLDAAGLNSIGLTAYDHNWDKPDYPITAFDEKNSFNSVSWHCYAGKPDGQDDFTKGYPDVPQHFTECTRILQFQEEPWLNLRKHAEQLLIGTIEHGSRSVILWNCVLQSDDNGFTNPHVPEVCSNCAAPVLIYNNNIQGLSQMNAKGLFEHPPTQFTRPKGKKHRRHMVRSEKANAKSQDDGGEDNKSPSFKLTSDYAALVHLNRATRLQAADEKTAIRTGVSTTEQAMGFPDGERVKAQAYKVKLSNGQYRYSLIVLQRHDHFLSGKFEAVNLVIGFQGQVANITNLPVGLHTFQWTA
ncbi:unnamed protein product [Sympodiomycopsis kandeliae]